MPDSWAGWRSWFLPNLPVEPMDNGSVLTRAAQPWVKTDSSNRPPRQLTAGSNLNRTAQGPWAPLLDTGLVYDFAYGTAWPPNHFVNVQVTPYRPANYGQHTSLAFFGKRDWYLPTYDRSVGAIAHLGPGPYPEPRRPMWNNLPPTLYNMRVANPSNAGMNEMRVFNSNAYSLVGNQFNDQASLNASGGQQGEVLL